MIINDEKKNAFTQSVMGDTEGGDSGGDSGGGGIVCEFIFGVDDSVTVNKTAGELWSALQKGSNILFHIVNPEYEQYLPLAYSMLLENGAYEFTLAFGENAITFTADTADDYPEYNGDR